MIKNILYFIIFTAVISFIVFVFMERTDYLPYITAIIAISGFVFSVYKYVDMKNTEEERRNYENYKQIMLKIGDITNIIDKKEKINVSEALFMIYQLKLNDFKKYSFISIPILKYLETRKIKGKVEGEACSKLYEEAIDYVLQELNAGQIATSGSDEPSSQ